MATIETLRTTYFRGRGAQRIRKVLIIKLEEGDLYVPGVGFSDPTLLGINIQPIIIAPVRDYTIRTLEPRARKTTDFGSAFAALYAGTHVILDFDGFDITDQISGPNYLRVRAYGIPGGGGGFGDEGEQGALAEEGTFGVEIEYTSNSGAEA